MLAAAGILLPTAAHADTALPCRLNTAADQWNQACHRGWTPDGGGGIGEEMNSKDSKCALSSDPMISTAVPLYLITRDGSYLTEAEAIRSWPPASRSGWSRWRPSSAAGDQQGVLAAGADPARAADACWVLTGPHLFTQLTVARGWHADAYRALLAGVLAATLLDAAGDPAAPGPRRPPGSGPAA